MRRGRHGGPLPAALAFAGRAPRARCGRSLRCCPAARRAVAAVRRLDARRSLRRQPRRGRARGRDRAATWTSSTGIRTGAAAAGSPPCSSTWSARSRAAAARRCSPGSRGRPAAGPTSREYALARIAGGDFDVYMTTWALAHEAPRQRPVHLRPMHEMNGDWYPWGGTVNGNSPAQYVQAWRRMHDIFRRVGASNVRFVWSPNNIDVPASNRMESYYPGDGVRRRARGRRLQLGRRHAGVRRLADVHRGLQAGLRPPARARTAADLDRRGRHVRRRRRQGRLDPRHVGPRRRRWTA